MNQYMMTIPKNPIKGTASRSERLKILDMSGMLLFQAWKG
jgi:hypothetical protein